MSRDPGVPGRGRRARPRCVPALGEIGASSHLTELPQPARARTAIACNRHQKVLLSRSRSLYSPRWSWFCLLVSYVAGARAQGEDQRSAQRSAQRLETQDRQCCAMEPRGKALERGAAERAEARTVAERPTGEAGGRSKRGLLLEAYYSTPCSCCTCTAALRYVYRCAAVRALLRVVRALLRCCTCTAALLYVHFSSASDVHVRVAVDDCCTCTAACCTCTAALR
jgi:hypothetical protein